MKGFKGLRGARGGDLRAAVRRTRCAGRRFLTEGERSAAGQALPARGSRRRSPSCSTARALSWSEALEEGERDAEGLAFGVGPSIAGLVGQGSQQGLPRGMAGLSGWIRLPLRGEVGLVGTVGYEMRQDPLPAEMEAAWASTWQVPVGVGLRFLPQSAIWETGFDGVLCWSNTEDSSLQAGGRLVVGRTAALGRNGARLRSEAHVGYGSGGPDLRLQTGVEVPW